MNHSDAYALRTQLAVAFPHARVGILWDGPRSYVVTVRESAGGLVEILTPAQARRFLAQRRVAA